MAGETQPEKKTFVKAAGECRLSAGKVKTEHFLISHAPESLKSMCLDLPGKIKLHFMSEPPQD